VTSDRRPAAAGAGRTGGATITLNRPRHLNRLHREDLLALQATWPSWRRHHAARGGAHRAAAAPSAPASTWTSWKPPAPPAQDPQLFEHTVDALEALPVPTIVRLNGSVYGGATDLALACDFRVGVQGMELRMPAARLGLHYYPSGLRRYVSRLGLQAAKRLFLLAETVPAEELLRIGYLDALAPAAELDAAVQGFTQALAPGAPLALRGMKLSLNEIGRGDFDLKRLRLREARCAASDDLREGLAAFAERREPRFTGR
jgi:enoyl-CoA hydratase